MSTAPRVTVTEVRVLEGPNLYFTRAAIKIIADCPGFLGADERVVVEGETVEPDEYSGPAGGRMVLETPGVQLGDVVVLRANSDPDHLAPIVDVPVTLSGLSEHHIAEALR